MTVCMSCSKSSVTLSSDIFVPKGKSYSGSSSTQMTDPSWSLAKDDRDKSHI